MRTRTGSIIDLPYNLSIVFMASIITLITGYIFFSMSGNLPGSFIAQRYIDSGANAFGTMNLGVIVVAGILFMASFIFALQVRTSPVYIIPTIVFLSTSIFIAAVYSNIYKKFAFMDGMISTANRFAETTLLMKNFHFIAFGVGILIIIGMFLITRRGGASTV